MPKLIKGNFPQILQKSGELLSPAFCADALASHAFNRQLQAILDDLKRATLIPAHPDDFENLIISWVSDGVIDKYLQGDMDSGIAQLLLKQFFLSPRFKPNTHLSESEKVERYGDRLAALRFSYFNDQGRPCGACIAYLENDPSLWVAVTTQNTTAESEKRDNTVIFADSMLESDGDLVIDGVTAANTFLDSLHSKRIAKLLRGVILEDGTVAVNQLNDLDKTAVQNVPEKYRDRITLMERKHTELKLENHKKLACYKNEIEAINRQIDETTKIFKKKINENNAIHENQIQTAAKIQTALFDKLKNSQLERVDKQSFARRNALSFIILSFITAVTISISLALCGVIPFLGLILAISFPPFLAVSAVIGVAALITTAIIVKISFDAMRLTNYRQEFAQIKNTCEQEALSSKTSCAEHVKLLDDSCKKEVTELKGKLEKEVNCFNEIPDVSIIQANYEKTCRETLTAIAIGLISATGIESSIDSLENSSNELTETRTDRAYSTGSNSVFFLAKSYSEKSEENGINYGVQ